MALVARYVLGWSLDRFIFLDIMTGSTILEAFSFSNIFVVGHPDISLLMVGRKLSVAVDTETVSPGNIVYLLPGGKLVRLHAVGHQIRLNPDIMTQYAVIQIFDRIKAVSGAPCFI